MGMGRHRGGDRREQASTGQARKLQLLAIAPCALHALELDISCVHGVHWIVYRAGAR